MVDGLLLMLRRGHSVMILRSAHRSGSGWLFMGIMIISSAIVGICRSWRRAIALCLRCRWLGHSREFVQVRRTLGRRDNSIAVRVSALSRQIPLGLHGGLLLQIPVVGHVADDFGIRLDSKKLRVIRHCRELPFRLLKLSMIGRLHKT